MLSTMQHHNNGIKIIERPVIMGDGQERTDIIISNGYKYVGAKYEYKNLKCIGCGIIFDSPSRDKTQRYCSRTCAGKNNINVGRMRKGTPAWNKGLKGYNAGYPRTKEWRDKISRANSGENAPNWRGGISKENERIRKTREYIAWRKAVFERDDYVCQECGDGYRNGVRTYLHADHIKPFALYVEERFNIENGRTLCAKCHRKTATYGMSMVYQKTAKVSPI